MSAVSIVKFMWSVAPGAYPCVAVGTSGVRDWPSNMASLGGTAVLLSAVVCVLQQQRAHESALQCVVNQRTPQPIVAQRLDFADNK